MMTPKERAAMQQALGALEAAGYGGSYAAIDLREALSEPDIEEMTLTQIAAKNEQAEQKPVGTAGELFTMSALERLDVRPSTKVYLNTAPVRTKDLTDDEIRAIWLKVIDPDGGDEVMALARAVIAADREKNK